MPSPSNLVHLGLTEHGEDVEIDDRPAESDLLVYVNINLVTMDGGHKSVATGLASYRSLKHHHNVRTLLNSRSLMDEHNSELRNSNWRMGRLIAASGVKIFQIETTLNTNTFPGRMAFLQKREWEWSLRDRATFLAASSALQRTPAGLSRKIFHSVEAPHNLTSVQTGEVEAVHHSTLANIYRQQLVEVQGQTDVLTMGLPYICPYNVNSTMNPILVACLGLGYFFNLYRNKPLVARAGCSSCRTRRRGSSTPSTTRATSTSSSRFWQRRQTCSRSRRNTRSRSPPTPGTCTSTAPATPTTGSTPFTCGTGAPMPCSTWAG